jgi:glycerol-3-phosphate dehydrogenase
VRGSHVVTRRLFDHDRAYILQQPDKRIVFAIPYEGDFTLIGTTDIEHDGAPGTAVCSDAERDYLLAAASSYFARPVEVADIVWSYSGVRPLYDDGASSATAATRDYVLELHEADGAAPVLDVFGGKITTHRRLAEAAMARLKPFLPGMGDAWTAGVALPGGDFPQDGIEALIARLRAAHPFLDAAWARRLARAYGTEAFALLAGATSREALGEAFGATLTEREVEWLMQKEWARSAEDILWRRSKLGLRLTGAEVARLEQWLGREELPAVGGAA